MSAVRAWRKQGNKAEAVLVDSNDVELLQQERTKPDSRMDDLSDANIIYVSEVTPSEAFNFDSLCDTHRRSLSDLNKKITDLKDDRSSVISKRGHDEAGNLEGRLELHLRLPYSRRR